MTENQRLSLNLPGTPAFPFERYDDGLEVVIHDGPEAVCGPEPGNQFDKYPVEIKPLSKWRERRFRLWITVAIGVIIFSIAVGTIVGIAAGYRHESSKPNPSPTGTLSSNPTLSPAIAVPSASTTQPPSSSPSAIAATSENLALDCPSIDKQVFSNTTTALEANGNLALTGTPYQFKRFCNKKPVNSSTLALVGNDPGVPQLSEPPTMQQTFEDCISQCVAFNLGISKTSILFSSCEGAYFNANLSSASDVGANCFLYVLQDFDNRLSDITADGNQLDAWAVMVSWNDATLVGTYLSDNGDWQGGVTTVNASVVP